MMALVLAFAAGVATTIGGVFALAPRHYPERKENCENQDQGGEGSTGENQPDDPSRLF